MKISPKVTPLRFWSQKVLPLVYDNSLSYYEVIDKLVFKVNEIIEYVNTIVYEKLAELISQFFVSITYDEENEEIVLSIGEEDE